MYIFLLVEFFFNMLVSWVFVVLLRIIWVILDIVFCVSVVLGFLNIEENVRWKVFLDCELKI